ncbi:transmembrane protein 72 [Conger conger]|uniref:transmembrane protein 72 n=1 Tax=Conger conger TaxID=82655 RepID=UPI002A5A8638|nr:transmembrane protein 72 [Conger conger]
MWCLPCPPKWKAFVLWKKLATLGGFQKFLYYTLMSVVCFLHPVLLWHAVIPGTMLLVTGVAYFILSKKQPPPAAKERAGLGAGYEDASAVTSSAGEGGEAEQTYSFFRVAPGNRTSALSLVPSAAGGGGAWAVEENPPPAGIRGARQVRFREDQAETQECQDAETTSDKAPMIPPTCIPPGIC